MPPYQGVCTRYLFTENQVELAYYQVGKIFRFQNLFTAWIDEDGGSKSMFGSPTKIRHEQDLEELLEKSEADQAANLTFHIFSFSGRRIGQFFGADLA